MTRLQRLNLAGLRALIVDDNASNREILQQHLLSCGVEVTTAGTSATALAALNAGDGPTFDLALVDDQMPGEDGFALATLIRQDTRWSALRLILLTTRDDHDSGESARLFAAVLAKPLRRSQLFACLARVMSGQPATAPEMLPGAVPAAPPPPARGAGPRILLVEDNPVNREVACRHAREIRAAPPRPRRTAGWPSKR